MFTIISWLHTHRSLPLSYIQDGRFLHVALTWLLVSDYISQYNGIKLRLLTRNRLSIKGDGQILTLWTLSVTAPMLPLNAFISLSIQIHVTKNNTTKMPAIGCYICISLRKCRVSIENSSMYWPHPNVQCEAFLRLDQFIGIQGPCFFSIDLS